MYFLYELNYKKYIYWSQKIPTELTPPRNVCNSNSDCQNICTRKSDVNEKVSGWYVVNRTSLIIFFISLKFDNLLSGDIYRKGNTG